MFHDSATDQWRHALLTLIRALVVSKVDYCNSMFTGLTGSQPDRLQSVVNVAARLVISAWKHEHINILRLRQLHWLEATVRIRTSSSLSLWRGTRPPRIELHVINDVDIRRRHRSTDSWTLLVPPTLRSIIGDRVFSAAARLELSSAGTDLITNCTSKKTENS